MELIDLDLDLSEEEKAIRDTVHKFAEEVMRPAGIQLDRLADPADVIAPDSVLWEVYKKHRELDLEMLTDPNSGLTPLQQTRLRPDDGANVGQAGAHGAIRQAREHRLLGRDGAGSRQRSGPAW
jgi:alkylation response protein AidB-like acyl-CoA dehydrogenase